MTSQRRWSRLFLDRDLAGDRLILDDREAHYLGNVLRLKRGDELVAFDGRGVERRATVVSLQRRGAELELGAHLDVLPESPLDLTLVQAVAKSEAMDLIVQKASELGVRRILPVHTEFSVVRLEAERVTRRLAHWQRIAQSACEQSGRHVPPAIREPDTLAAVLDEVPRESLKLALDPGAEQRFARGVQAAAVVLAIGPEGGFSTADLQILERAGFTRAGLGARVLRTETAAIAACAVAQLVFGDL